MDGELFYYVGGALVLAALVLAAIGIRGKESFPSSRGMLVGVTTVFFLLVASTATYAVVNAREEQKHHREEKAEAEAHAEAEVEEAAGAEREDAGAAGAAPIAQGEEQGVGDDQAGAGGPGEPQALDLTSPEDGSLVFEPDSLEAVAGAIAIVYENPSPVQHNVNIEDEGETIAESETITDGSTELSAELTPGQYVFYCSVPGHREGGMEGDLLVE